MYDFRHMLGSFNYLLNHHVATVCWLWLFVLGLIWSISVWDIYEWTRNDKPATAPKYLRADRIYESFGKVADSENGYKSREKNNWSSDVSQEDVFILVNAQGRSEKSPCSSRVQVSFLAWMLGQATQFVPNPFTVYHE